MWEAWCAQALRLRLVFLDPIGDYDRVKVVKET